MPALEFNRARLENRRHEMKAGLISLSVKKAVQVLGFTLGALLFCLPASAQLNYGRIYGSITDQSGGAMSGATVTVIDADRGISRPLTTDDSGTYSASSLLPGNYTVRAAATGFKGGEHAGITVGVGQDVRVDFSLQPGAQTETVTVTGDVPMVNTTSATLGGTLETAAIVDLPLNGRAFQKLLDFSPGMQQIPGGGTPAYNANGQRGGNITWMLDGVDEINMAGGAGPTVGGNGGGVDGVTILSLDAIQEINIVQNPKAEYGWMGGAVVNVGLKSGTNAMHGTAFAFGRDNALDARNAFINPAAGQSKAEDTLTQFGATLGGPIKKDKMFYFMTYEGNRYTLGAVKNVTEPTDLAGLGTTSSIPDAIAALNLAGTTLSPMAVKMAGCNLSAIGPTTGTAVAAFCGPNATGGAPLSLFGNNSNAPTYATAFNNNGGSNNGLAKVDYHVNDKSTINAEYFIGIGIVNNAVSATQPFWLADNHFHTSTGRVVWVWTPRSSLVNEMRFGLLEYNQLGSPDDCNGHDGAPNYATTYGYNLGITLPAPQCGMANITMTGFSNLGSQSSNGGPQDNHFSVWSGTDSLSYTRGQHLFKFGGEIHDTRFSGSKSLTNDNGTFAFKAVGSLTALQEFLAGQSSSSGSSILVGNATLTSPVAYNRYALFAQDDWRIKPRITLNLGLRWEYVAPITSANNVLGNFNVSAPTGLVQETGGNAVYKLPKDMFQPRVGVAWDVTGKGTTVVRAGATYMNDFLVFQQLLPNLQNVPTGFALTNINGSLVTPQPGNNLLGTLALSTSTVNWGTKPGPVVQFTPNTVNSFGFACGDGLGQNPALPVSGTNPANPAACNLSPAVTDPNNYKPDGVISWNLSVQHAFNNNLSLNVAYVGTHTRNLRGTTDVNQPTLGLGGTTVEEQRRPFWSNCPASPCFPYLGQVLVQLPNQRSNYNALQTTLTERLSHGLQFSLGYTFAHALDESSGVSNSANGNLENTQNPGLDYGNAAFDARHHLTFTGTYDIPGRKAPLQSLTGWQVNATETVLSALPFNAYDGTNDLSGTGILQDRWNIAGDPKNFTAGTSATIPCFGLTGSKTFGSTTSCTIVPAGTGSPGQASFVSGFPSQCLAAAAGGATNSALPAANNPYGELATLGCYVENGTAIAPAGQGTYGDMAHNVLRGHAFKETDVSVTKTWNIRESLKAQFRAEIFNVFNAVNYATPYQTTNSNLAAPTNFGRSLSTPNTFSFIFGSGGPRTMQMALKFMF
jgi:hypothetical protein